MVARTRRRRIGSARKRWYSRKREPSQKEAEQAQALALEAAGAGPALAAIGPEEERRGKKTAREDDGVESDDYASKPPGDEPDIQFYTRKDGTIVYPRMVKRESHPEGLIDLEGVPKGKVDSMDPKSGYHSFTACSGDFQRLANRLTLLLSSPKLSTNAEELHDTAAELIVNCITEREKSQELFKTRKLNKYQTESHMHVIEVLRELLFFLSQIPTRDKYVKEKNPLDPIEIESVGTKFKVTIKSKEGDDEITTITAKGPVPGSAKGGRKTYRKRRYRRFT